MVIKLEIKLGSKFFVLNANKQRKLRNDLISWASAGILDGGGARLIMGPTGAKRFSQRRVVAESISWGGGVWGEAL